MANPYTYRDLIRIYADNLAKGHTDTDLTPQVRRLVRVMLNVASNAGWAGVIYPPTEETRAHVMKHLGDILWEAGAIIDAISPTAHGARVNAWHAACEILRNL